MRDCFWVTEDYCRLILSGGDSLKVNSYSNAATFEHFYPLKLVPRFSRLGACPSPFSTGLSEPFIKVVFLYLWMDCLGLQRQESETRLLLP